MKKLFTLVVAAFAALSVCAQTKNLGEPSNNTTDVKDGVTRVWYDSGTKTVTFHEKNSYRPGWWLATWDNTLGANVGTDYSDFDEFVVELDNPNQVDVNVRVEFYDTKEACTAHGTGNEFVVSLDKTLAKKVQQAYLQCSSDITDPVSVTFKNAYFKAVSSGNTSVLFEGNQVFDSWKPNITIEKETFANTKAGDKIVVTGMKGSVLSDAGWNLDWGGQVYLKTKRSGWDNLCKSFSMTDVSSDYVFVISDDEITINEKQPDPNDDTKSIEIPVKTTPLKELQNYGLAIQGIASVVTKVELISSGDPTNISNTIAAPAATSSKVYNLAGQQVGASYKGIVVKNGKKFVQK